YDASCSRCSRLAHASRGFLRRWGWRTEPLQAPWVSAKLGLPDAQLLSEMRLLTADGKSTGGADAVIQLARSIWWAWPVYTVSLVPGVRSLMGSAYRWVASHRRCTPGQDRCVLPR
ncbi:MAG: DCC1-like thiol-disulfide oxidoreductase family protein, partial [Planctomycetota bacterium]|nr:DCC1-like thiol-disulfide oxidoreductase family protein [Planctomycetota bacterium]